MQAARDDEDGNAVLARARAFADEARGRVDAVRDAMAALDDFRADCAAASDRGVTLGTEAEVAAASAILHRSLEQALDHCSERDLTNAAERGWLLTDQAARAVKEKRLRELARVRDGKDRGERGHDRE